jgi:hypothetical protein
MVAKDMRSPREVERKIHRGMNTVRDRGTVGGVGLRRLYRNLGGRKADEAKLQVVELSKAIWTETSTQRRPGFGRDRCRMKKWVTVGVMMQLLWW